MTKHLNVSVNDELFDMLEQKRGDLPMSIFIRKLLAKALEVSNDFVKVRR